MYIKQADLFRGVSMDFLKKVMQATRRESHPANTQLFASGDPASWFYVLINGRVELRSDPSDNQVFIGCNTGETFGCANLFGMDAYQVTARCLTPTDLLKIDVVQHKRLLNRYITDGFVFYRNLTQILGKRLLHSYHRDVPSDAA